MSVKELEKPIAEGDGGSSLNGEGGAPAGSSPAKIVLRIVLILALIVGATIGIRYLMWTRGHASTDDAYVTGDVVQISPQVSGTVTNVLVKDNQLVKKGDLLVTLDDSTFRAAVEQAQANLDVAIAQAQGAGVSVNLTQETGSAQITQAQGGIGQAASGIASARASVAQARAAVSSAKANEKRARASASSARAAISTAKANLAAARAAVNAAEANYENAAREAKRFQTLAKQGAESQERADTVQTAATSAKAALDSANQQVESAKAQVDAKQADLDAADEQVRASQASIDQAKASLVAAQEGVPQAMAKHTQAQGQLNQAKTVTSQVAVSKTAKQQAEAKVEQARAALKNAQLQLSYCRIYAPTDGRVSKKSVEVGELVQPGTPLMALVPSNVWVVANYKETQMKGMADGRKASVYVDAVPGHSFKGRVESIAAGTGSTFALLPPENATGNFVKVVQRVPVKIELDPGQPGVDHLRAGMSVTAVVETK